MRRSLLLATACATAAILAMPLSPAIAQQDTNANITGAVESQTLADQYPPYLGDITFSRSQQESYSTMIRTENGDPLPAAASVSLIGGKGDSVARLENGVLFRLRFENGYHYIDVYQDIFPPFNDEGNTTTARLLVSYRDRSENIIESKITIFPTLEQVNAVTYGPTEMNTGEAAVASPTTQSSRAAGTQYALVESEVVEALRQDGWAINVNPISGAVTVTAPNKEGTAHVPVFARYPDGTSQTIHAEFHATTYVEPSPTPTPPAKPGRSFGSSFS